MPSRRQSGSSTRTHARTHPPHRPHARTRACAHARYLRCSELPNPLDQADIDTYLSLVETSEDRELMHAVDDLQV